MPPSRPATRGWRGRLETVSQSVLDIPVVSGTLAVVNTANEAAAGLFAASLAFNTMFAVIPLLLLLSGVLGWLITDPIERARLLADLVAQLPPLADLLETALDGVVSARGALSVVGVIGLLWGASSFYGSLDEVMRRLFPGGGVHGFIAQRVRGVLTVVVLLGVIAGTVSLGGLWALVDALVGELIVWRYAVPLIAMAVIVVVVLASYLLIPTAPPSLRAALPPAVVAGVGIGLLTNLFSVLAPWLIGGLSGFGLLAAIFGALVWLNFSYLILLYGAAWARLRRDQETAVSSAAEVP